MRYVVRTVAWRPERLENVEKLREQIPELEVVTDYVRDGYASFFEACRQIDGTGAVLLEDDAILCGQFTQRSEYLIKKHGDGKEVLNFFEKPKVDISMGYIGGSNFASMVCIYLPPQLPGKIISYHDEFKDRRYHEWTGMATDMLIKYALIREKRKYWRIRPALVQHSLFKSSIGHRALDRQTPYFIDDLEESQYDLRFT